MLYVHDLFVFPSFRWIYKWRITLINVLVGYKTITTGDFCLNRSLFTIIQINLTRNVGAASTRILRGIVH